MGNQRTYVTFEADFPDDVVFDESGELAVPGGRNICEKLVECMRAEGFTVSEPEQYKFYGWEFTANLHGALTWMMLQETDPWLLMAEDRSGKFGWLRMWKEPSDSLLNLINDFLKKVDRISNILWFTPDGYHSVGKVGNPTP